MRAQWSEASSGRFSERLARLWYGKHVLTFFLLPLAWCYGAVVGLRRRAYVRGLLAVYSVPVPVIVVGNLSVGGTGKTPVVIWLVETLRAAGYAPGIVSRGYGGKARRWPQPVRADSDPALVGDEPVLLARRCRCPVAVAPDRVAAVSALLAEEPCDVIIADDGLQHYALGRTLEIAVIDAERRFGNGHCLPAGPLREPLTRLQAVDLVIANGQAQDREFAMTLVVGEVVNLWDSTRRQCLADFSGHEVHAVAGIGYPGRFFSQLRQAGLRVREHPFPDHHPFRPTDLQFGDDRPVLMTEKDAVKCQTFTAEHPQNVWYVPIQARPDDGFARRVLALLEAKTRG